MKKIGKDIEFFFNINANIYFTIIDIIGSTNFGIINFLEHLGNFKKSR